MSQFEINNSAYVYCSIAIADRLLIQQKRNRRASWLSTCRDEAAAFAVDRGCGRGDEGRAAPQLQQSDRRLELEEGLLPDVIIVRTQQQRPPVEQVEVHLERGHAQCIDLLCQHRPDNEVHIERGHAQNLDLLCQHRPDNEVAYISSGARKRLREEIAGRDCGKRLREEIGQ